MSSEPSSWKKFYRSRFSSKKIERQFKTIEKKTLKHTRRFVTSRLYKLTDVRRHVIGWMMLVLILTGLSAGQWLLSQKEFTANAFVSGGTYSEGVLGPLETLNPLFARSSAEKSARRLLFSGLYKYDEDGYLKSDLAKDVSINKEETEYTVKLRPDLKWSDGATLNANDVVFTVNLLRDSKTRSEITGWQSIKAERIDDNTVKFILSASYAPFMHALTFPILPEHSLAGINPSDLRTNIFSKTPVTSGPFVVRMSQENENGGANKIVLMMANKYYHGGKPKLERFQLYVYSSRDDIAKALRTSEVMATPELVYVAQPEEIQRMYKVSSHTINDGVYALFNTKSPVLSSPKIRKALSLSVDTDELRGKLARSTASLYGPLLSNQTSSPVSKPKHDVEAAKKILDGEGWKVKNSDGIRQKGNDKLTMTLVTLKGLDYEQSANELARIWRSELGIDISIRVVDPADAAQNVLQAILQPRNFDILIYELAFGGDPDVYAYWHSSQASANGLNFSNYKNVIADDALVSGRAKLSPKQRQNRYAIFTQRWQSDTPALPLYQPKIDYMQLPSIQALGDDKKLVGASDRFYNVNYWATVQASVYKTP